MDIFKIAAIGIVAAVLSLILKRSEPMLAILLSIAASVLIFVLILPQFRAVMDLFKRIGSGIDVGGEYIVLIIKIIGIAYAAEFGSQICTDAGEGSVAAKIELAGKVMIMAVSAPIIISLMEQIVSIIP